MSWRTVVISSRSKLDFKMNYMIIRKDFETTKIYIDEIYMLVIESTAVSLTAVLLNELIKKKVAIVFCDEKRNPASEVLPLHGSHNSSKRCREQADWSKDVQAYIWTEIVRRKIMNQAELLKYKELKEADLLYQYLDELTLMMRLNVKGMRPRYILMHYLENHFLGNKIILLMQPLTMDMRYCFLQLIERFYH